MAGVSTETQAKTGRRPLDSQVNLIPMIDLLVCCISFLLITAVWSHMSRISLRPADTPGDAPGPMTTEPVERSLHVEVRSPEAFTLVWRQGRAVISTAEVPRHPVEAEVAGVRQVRYPDLAARVQAEWQANGSHRDHADPKLDRAVLHAPNQQAFGDLVAVIDAVHSVRRGGGAANDAPAFSVSFATD
jgi:biopolymer transport protein ExbD